MYKVNFYMCLAVGPKDSLEIGVAGPRDDAVCWDTWLGNDTVCGGNRATRPRSVSQGPNSLLRPPGQESLAHRVASVSLYDTWRAVPRCSAERFSDVRVAFVRPWTVVTAADRSFQVW